jgi:hypothetical protein
VVDPQGYLRFLVGPPNAFHIYQISTDEHRGRESRKKIPINVPLHGSVRRPKVIPGGCDFHVFHDLAPLVLAITRLIGSKFRPRAISDVSPQCASKRKSANA